MESGEGGGRLPTLLKYEEVHKVVVENYTNGLRLEGAKKTAVDYANAVIEDMVFNPNNYDQDDEELKRWQDAVAAAEEGNNMPLKNRFLDQARVFLQVGDLVTEKDTVKDALAFLNLIFSIPDKDQQAKE